MKLYLFAFGIFLLGYILPHPERQKLKFFVVSGDFHSLFQPQGDAHYKTKNYSYPGTRNINFVIFLQGLVFSIGRYSFMEWPNRFCPST